MQLNSTGPLDAKIMFIGDAPSLEDTKTGKLFSGSTLDNLLSQASIARYQCSFTNIAQDCPPAGRISYFFEDTKCTIPKPKMQHWIDSLKEETELLKPNIVVTLGPTALYVLTGEKKLADFRGYILESSLVPGLKVLPTYHPKEINFDWKLYFQAVLDLRKAVRHSNNPNLPISTQTYIPGATYQQFISYMENLIAHPEWEYLSIDVETVQPGSHIEELGLSHDPSFGISFFLLKNRAPTLPENDELLLWQTFSRLISIKKIVMQNAAYDTGVLWYNNKILVQNLYMDTLIAAHICWPELPRDLGFLGSICLDVPPWKHGSAKNQDYNPADAANTLGIAKVLDIELDKQKSRHTFDFEMGMIPVSLMMQLQGISVDIKMKKALTKAWTARKAQMEKQLFTLLGRTINFNSPKQMQQLLYADLGLPPQYKRRKSVQEKRTLTSDAATLRTLSRLVPDNPVFNLILAYKKADTLLHFLDVELSPEGKVHTSYNITGASSDDEEDTKKTKRSFGRWSSSKSIILPFGSGNLQNIPPNARKMYKAPKSWKIIEADYVQAEAVIVAYLTGNQKLKQMFKDSFGLAPSERGQYDLHKITAAEMFGIPLNQVTKTQRTAGKTIRHAKNYCVDDKTEVLTESGWKPIYLINKEADKVAQWDKDGTIQFVKPIQTFKYEYKGELLHFKKLHYSQCVTENHRVPVWSRSTNELKVIMSQTWFNADNGDYSIPVSGKINGSSSITPEFIRLFTALQADGSFRERDRHGKEISFTIKKDRKIKRLVELLDNCEIKYSMYDASEDRVGFYISGKLASELFSFAQYTNKKFGSWILHLSQECLNALVDESKWWDSRRNKSGNSWQYYSVHRSNCEWLQTAAHLTGRSAIINNDHPTVFTLSITDNKMFTDSSRGTKKLVNYDGYVYSLQVPSSFYLIRRDGLISVTGNSAGPLVIANRLGIKLSEAKLLMELYDKADPSLHAWHERIQVELKRSRVLTNLLGRKHHFLDRWGDNLFRSAYSYIPQSTIGDLLNVSLRKVYDSLPTLPFEVVILLQLHDAIYVMVEDENVDFAIKHLRKLMIHPLTYLGEEFTVDVDFKIKTSWAKGKEVDLNWREK